MIQWALDNNQQICTRANHKDGLGLGVDHVPLEGEWIHPHVRDTGLVEMADFRKSIGNQTSLLYGFWETHVLGTNSN